MKNYEKEDYGQTLGAMGIGEGCYLVLPVLGPSTVKRYCWLFCKCSGGDAWYNVLHMVIMNILDESDFISKKLTWY